MREEAITAGDAGHGSFTEARMRSDRKRVAALAVLPLLALAAAARAGPPGVTEPRVREAVSRSLAWLDGNLPRIPDAEGTPRKQFTYAVAGLVRLMAHRRAADVGAVRKYLASYVDRVEERSRDVAQLPEAHGRFDSRQLSQYTWPLAQAAVFFSELWLRGLHRSEAKATLRKILRLLLEAQESNGGWGHGRIRPATPTEPGAPEGGTVVRTGGYPSTLLAATNCVASALGIVEATLGRGTVEGLDRARRYYRKARLPDGNFPYDPSQRSSGRSLSGVGRTGGALMAMHFLGFADRDPDVRGSLEFLLKRLDYASEGHGSATLNLAHTAFALRLLDDLAFERFKSVYFPRILEKQGEEGSFDCVCEGKAFGTSCDRPRDGMLPRFRVGAEAYVTALHAFILLLDQGRLEVLERKPVPAPARGEATERPRRRRR
jgi:hypothetical protein